MIKFEDWKKLEMRVGKILKVERVPETTKLYKLQVDIGDKKIQIVTSLVPYYSEKELKNRFKDISSSEINDYLWLAGQIKHPEDKPYHRTRTIAY